MNESYLYQNANDLLKTGNAIHQNQDSFWTLIIFFFQFEIVGYKKAK